MLDKPNNNNNNNVNTDNQGNNMFWTFIERLILNPPISWLLRLIFTWVLIVRSNFRDESSIGYKAGYYLIIISILLSYGLTIYNPSLRWLISYNLIFLVGFTSMLLSHERLGLWVTKKILCEKTHWVNTIMKPILKENPRNPSKDPEEYQEFILAGFGSEFFYAVYNGAKTGIKGLYNKAAGATAIGGVAVVVTDKFNRDHQTKENDKKIAQETKENEKKMEQETKENEENRAFQREENDKKQDFEVFKMRQEQYTRDKTAWDKSWLGTEKNKPIPPKWPQNNEEQQEKNNTKNTLYNPRTKKYEPSMKEQGEQIAARRKKREELQNKEKSEESQNNLNCLLEKKEMGILKLVYGKIANIRMFLYEYFVTIPSEWWLDLPPSLQFILVIIGISSLGIIIFTIYNKIAERWPLFKELLMHRIEGMCINYIVSKFNKFIVKYLMSFIPLPYTIINNGCLYLSNKMFHDGKNTAKNAINEKMNKKRLLDFNDNFIIPTLNESIVLYLTRITRLPFPFINIVWNFVVDKTKLIYSKKENNNKKIKDNIILIKDLLILSVVIPDTRGKRVDKEEKNARIPQNMANDKKGDEIKKK